MKSKKQTVLALVAHPDDAEFLCAGALALLSQRDWRIVMATMTPGDCGSVEYNREEISRIRTAEAAESAALLDAEYHCLECDDIFMTYDRPTLLKAITLIRRIQPQIVMTMSPSCYMVDHEVTSRVVQTACFSAGMINIKTENYLPFSYIPHLYYLDPMEGKDRFGKEVKASMVVDVSTVIDIKGKMLGCHLSQRNWLNTHHGMEEYTNAMRVFSARRGKEIAVKYGEGFRQHLGHAFPQENLLKKELGNLVHLMP